MRLIRFTENECDFLERILEDVVEQDLDTTGQASSLLVYLETTAGTLVDRDKEVEG